ncbi:MAG: hypothetical protein FWC77_02655 [Defluviitaleaceae bacterium]|nr:hypothetical protein [Defluviitaleaceae bacterium]
MQEDEKLKKDEKWDFADYAFTITGIIVGVLLVVPELLESIFEISILGGSLGNAFPELTEYESNTWTLNQLRALSPMLFLLTTTIVFFKEAIDARKTGGYKGSMFTHTFESLFEESIYMAITTIMVYSAVLAGVMYASWLAGPITWVLFIFIFPLVRKKDEGAEKTSIPWLLLLVLIAGIVAEVIMGGWVAFPLSWLLICAFKLIGTIYENDRSIDTVFNILYYAFSVILMAVGIGFDFWIASWTAFPIAVFICWVIKKFYRDKPTTT